MYRRFLNNNDYLGIITPEALAQITRGDNERFIQAEESAEISIVEYLSENYEIERELNKGKYIAEYDRQICYPCRAHVYYQGKIHEVIKAIGGYKAPADVEYWDEIIDINIDTENLLRYSQFETYRTGDTVQYNDSGYICLHDNGYKFENIRIPMVHGWIEAETYVWQPIDYNQWEIVSFEGNYYTLLSQTISTTILPPWRVITGAPLPIIARSTTSTSYQNTSMLFTRIKFITRKLTLTLTPRLLGTISPRLILEITT